MIQISILCICFLLAVTTFVRAEEDFKLFDSSVNPATYLIRTGDKLLVTFINSNFSLLVVSIPYLKSEYEQLLSKVKVSEALYLVLLEQTKMKEF